MTKDKFEIIKNIHTVKDSKSSFLGTSSYKNMLDNIHKGCYVEAESTNQGGTVVSIIKNKDKIPVCVKVTYKEENSKTYYDHISVDRISFMSRIHLVFLIMNIAKITKNFNKTSQTNRE